MGTPKQLLPIAGAPMVRHAAMRALESPCRPVLVVCGSAFESVTASLRDLPVRLVENSRWQAGIGASIHAGIRAASAPGIDAAIVALADQPCVTGATYDRLAGHWKRGAGPVVACEYGGTIGAPVLFDRSFFPTLLEVPADRGCKQLIEELDASLVVRCQAPEALLDIDTPAQYRDLGNEERQIEL
jgi:molybdenum cofactor cytidylyltransferase